VRVLSATANCRTFFAKYPCLNASPAT
jgi:hypothetical protein